MPAGNRSSLFVDAGEGSNPFLRLATNGKGSGRSKVRAYLELVRSIIGGGLTTRRTRRPRIIGGKARAVATVVVASTANGNTVTINGVATTATQHNSRGTVTCASVSAADTVTVNGVVFTAVNGGTPTSVQFDMSGSDTADAASLVSAINAHPTLSGVVTAANAAGVVTIRAVTAGAGGDAITLASSTGVRLAVSGATLSGGATVVENQFDFGGTDIQTATALAAAINLDTDALVDDIVEACNLAATFTLASVAVGDSVSIAGYTFTAKALSTANCRFNEFSQSGTDTQDAASLVTQINAREGLNQLVFASSSSGVVTIRQFSGTTACGTLAETGSTITLSGQLAATATVLISAYRSGVMGNCITLAATGPTASAARLSGGSETKLTY